MRSEGNRSKEVTEKVQVSIPRLRFPEFSELGEWQEKKLEECLDYQQPTAYLVSHTNYDDSYETPVLTAGKTFVLGYTNDKDGIYEDNLPVIIFDDFTTATQFVDFPFKAKSSAMKILSAKSGSNTKFMYEAMQLISYDVGVHERHWISRFSPMEILAPGRNEQNKIADCLSSLDACIGAETQKLDTLKAHKQSLMQQLFPAEGERLPRLRFPGFEGEWIVEKLGDKSTVVRGGSPRPIDSYITRAADGLSWLKIGDVDKTAKYIERTEQKVIPAALGKTRQVHPGDLILSNSMSFGRPYISKIVACIHDGWIAITNIEDQVAPDFLYYALGSHACQSYFLNAAAGSGVKNLNADIINQLSVAIPTLEEQQKITRCMSELDEVIAAQSRKITMFHQHKSGLMQGLFPALDA